MSRKGRGGRRGGQIVGNSSIGGHNIQIGVAHDVNLNVADPPFILVPGLRPAVPKSSEWLQRQPSRLLDARSRVVPFFGRERESTDLCDWLDQDADVSALLLHGPGGQGKTRLATHIVEAAIQRGWGVAEARLVPDLDSAGMGDSLGLPSDAALIVLVDYGDRWPHPHLLKLFSTVALRRQSKVRVLLVGRSVRWWPAVRGELADLRCESFDLLLEPIAPTGRDRREFLLRAVESFATPLAVELGSRELPISMTENPDLDSALSLSMAALVWVDSTSRSVTAPTDLTGLSAYLLDREYAAWRRMYERKQAGEEFDTPPSIMARAAFVATLIGAGHYSSRRSVLDRLRVDAPDRVLMDHRLCYPPIDRGTVLEPLYPDRLAEDFLALMLPGHGVTSYDPDPWTITASARLLKGVEDLDDLDGGSAEKPQQSAARAVIYLTAAAGRGWSNVANQLNRVLAENPEIGVRSGSAGLSAIATVDSIDLVTLEAIAQRFPDHPRADLDVGIAAVMERLTEARLAAAEGDSERAHHLFGLAMYVDNAGDRQRAIGVMVEATEIYERLQERTISDVANLAGALNNLGIWYEESGEHEKAFEATRRARGIYHETLHPALGDPLPSFFVNELISIENNWATRLADKGFLEDAVRVTESVIGLCSHLASAHGPTIELEIKLAAAWANMGEHLRAIGEMHKSLVAYEKSVTLRRSLADKAPMRFLGQLAGTLDHSARLLAQLGQYDDALARSIEATGHYDELYRISPNAFSEHVDLAKRNLINLLSSRGRYRDALEVANFELDHDARRPCVDEYHQILGRTNLLEAKLHVLTMLQKRPEAILSARECVELVERLSAGERAASDRGLAQTLSNMSADVAMLGEMEIALDLAQRSLEISRSAGGLMNLGNALHMVGRSLEARTALGEAVQMYREQVAANQTASGDLAAALGNLATVAGNEDPEFASEVATEAVLILRDLVAQNRSNHLHMLALALLAQSENLISTGMYDSAESSAQEAKALLEEMQPSVPEVMTPQIEICNHVLSRIHVARER